MSAFYKMDPADWDFGTASLSLEEEAAYLRIVNAINKHDAPVPNMDRVLAGMFRCSTRKARALRDALEAAGKIYIEDGKIWNDRARVEVNSRSIRSEKCAESGAKGGRASAASRSVRDHFADISTPEMGANGERKHHETNDKSLKNNKQGQATASSRIEENRIESPLTPQGGQDAFAEFWKIYPRRVGKGAARKKFDVATKKASVGAILDGARRYASECAGREERFIAHPATWLNQERWTDETQGMVRQDGDHLDYADAFGGGPLVR